MRRESLLISPRSSSRTSSILSPANLHQLPLLPGERSPVAVPSQAASSRQAEVKVERRSDIFILASTLA